MSTSNQTTDRSTANFTAIFEAASNEYKTLTGQDLGTHPLATDLESNNSPDSILDVFRKQAQVFDPFCKGDDKLMKLLTPIVHVVLTLSTTLGGIGLPFSPATVLFAGISVLLGVVRDFIESFKTLVDLFERTQFFLQRLHQYTIAPLTPEMMVLLAKILGQVLSVLAFSTKAMKESRIKQFMKRLVGKTDVEDALQRLDMLTKEENLMVAARTLGVSHRIDDNISGIKEVIRGIREDVNEIKEDTRNVDDNPNVTTRDPRSLLRQWLAPPNPSINYNTAYETKHGGTAKWFIQGSVFDEWKRNGSLLWIRGNPGSGKSVLSSAIVEDIKHMRESKSALAAYYYFDFKDAAKRDIRGLLASLLLQLVDDSDRCRDLLSQLHKTCRNGSEQPTEAELARCLKGMLDLPGQLPIYLIIDALDECPNITGTPSAREKVLNFVEDLVQSDRSNLFICITSRPEQDISTTLNPLTSQSFRVSLHEEGGQREDINNYIRYFVLNDKAIRRWREEDKELVIGVLSERAHGMFRWVYCQLDNLRRCMPSSIRKSLNELPVTLDETYERTLQCIPKQRWQHAHRLFQCLVSATRPLRAEELAEIFAIEFGSNATLSLVEDWRPENPEEALLSACSALISIITDDEGSKIVQFSHFSVKEFLTSDRLETSDVENVRQYYISLEHAHTLMAQSCLAVLLQLDEKVDRKRLETFALAFYAAEHWVDHAKFQNVISQIRDAMEDLFNPMKPHFRAWLWIHDATPWRHFSLGMDDRPSPPDITPLYCAAWFGFSDLAKHLIIAHAEDVNAKCRDCSSPLHAVRGRDAANVLLEHGADKNAKKFGGGTPLHIASYNGQSKVVQSLLEHGATVDARNDAGSAPIHHASENGYFEIVRLLLDHGADVSIRGSSGTPFQVATSKGHHDIARLLQDHGAQYNRSMWKYVINVVWR